MSNDEKPTEKLEVEEEPKPNENVDLGTEINKGIPKSEKKVITEKENKMGKTKKSSGKK